MFRNFNNGPDLDQKNEPAISTKIDELRESHWIKYCKECPEDCACKDYEI